MDRGQKALILRKMLESHRDYAGALLQELERNPSLLEQSWFPVFPEWPHESIIHKAVDTAARAGLGTTCPLATDEARTSDMAQFLVMPGGARSAFRELRDFTKNAERLTIIDPYLYACRGDVDAYVSSFEYSLGVDSGKRTVHSIHIICNRQRGQQARQAIWKAMRDRGCTVTEKGTNLIHDRIWIADSRRAVVVGTSLNGLGKDSASFILNLPEADLQALWTFRVAKKLTHRLAT